MAGYDRAAIMAEVCERIANGESLRKICESDSLPAASTILLWLTEDETLSEQYARAREAQADVLADEIVSIADEAKDAALGRLRMDARKWVAAKLKPKKYGEKVAHVGGGDGDAPIAFTAIERHIVRPSD